MSLIQRLDSALANSGITLPVVLGLAGSVIARFSSGSSWLTIAGEALSALNHAAVPPPASPSSTSPPA